MSKNSEQVAEAWGAWVAEMGEWHVFGALTYDPSRRDRVPGNDVAKANVRRWLGRGLRTLGRPVEAAVVALEYQRNGWPHFHPLLRIAGGVQPAEIAQLATSWSARHGHARLAVPRDQLDVTSYAAKYLAKDLDRGDVLFWPTVGSLSVHQLAIVGREDPPAHLKEGRPGRRAAARAHRCVGVTGAGRTNVTGVIT